MLFLVSTWKWLVLVKISAFTIFVGSHPEIISALLILSNAAKSAVQQYIFYAMHWKFAIKTITSFPCFFFCSGHDDLVIIIKYQIHKFVNNLS